VPEGLPQGYQQLDRWQFYALVVLTAIELQEAFGQSSMTSGLAIAKLLLMAMTLLLLALAVESIIDSVDQTHQYCLGDLQAPQRQEAPVEAYCDLLLSLR